MAFSASSNNLPTDYYPGFLQKTSSGTSISGVATDADYILIPLTALGDGGLSLAEAHITTGNGNKVVYALIKSAYAQLQAESSAARPESLTLTESSISGLSEGSYSQTITMKAIFDISASDILDES